MRRVIFLADVVVGITGAHEWAAAVDLLFGGSPPAEGVPDLELTIGDAPPARPTRSPDVAYDDDVCLWFEPDGLVAFDRLGVGSHASGARVYAGGSGDDRSWRLVVQYALVDALARRGRHAVHAAAIARDGGAVLALGDAGAGKSSLAFAALVAGWHVLADDIAWIRRDPSVAGEVAVAGFPKPLAVPAELLAGREDRATTMAADPRARRLLSFDALTTGSTYPLVGVVLVEHAADEGRLLAARSGPALLATVLRSHPLAESARTMRAFFPVAGAVSRLPAATLQHDRDPARRVARTGALLAEAVARFGRADRSQ